MRKLRQYISMFVEFNDRLSISYGCQHEQLHRRDLWHWIAPKMKRK